MLALRVQFSRLFDLTIDRWVTVEEMARRGWDEGGSTWVWRRRLLAWEEESVSDCAILLHNIVLQGSVLDRWRWLLDPINGYSVKGTHHFLTMADTPMKRGLFDDVWHRQVPLKVSLFAWRLLRNRLPTKDNLVRRQILHIDDNVCMIGCGTMETADHFLFTCDTFGRVWFLVMQWLHLYFVPPRGNRNHLFQFGNLAGLPYCSHSFIQIIWLTYVWVIRKERNNHVFHQHVADTHRLAGSVKLLSFQWLKANKSTFVFSYHGWWMHPLYCMGVM